MNQNKCIVTNVKLISNPFVQGPLVLHLSLSALLVQYVQSLHRHQEDQGNLIKREIELEYHSLTARLAKDAFMTFYKNQLSYIL